MGHGSCTALWIHNKPNHASKLLLYCGQSKTYSSVLQHLWGKKYLLPTCQMMFKGVICKRIDCWVSFPATDALSFLGRGILTLWEASVFDGLGMKLNILQKCSFKRCMFIACACVSELNGLWPAMRKITPPARATLSFCSGSSAMQVVHLRPTLSTKIEMKLSKMDDSISPCVPCTIPGDKDTAQDPWIWAGF